MSDQNNNYVGDNNNGDKSSFLSEKVEEVEPPLGVLTSNTAPIQSVGESTNPLAGQQKQQNRSSKQFPKQPTIQQVSTFGSFPGAGSQLGPYFCLGRLGRGTFCSIHRCIDMRYFHQYSKSSHTDKHRTVAAKVELSSFVNSGVLDGEATMLQHLDRNTTNHAVPVYFGHYRSCPDSDSAESNTTSDTPASGVVPPSASAIVMEYLPGEDMHILRNRHTQRYKCRRLAIQDAVYLTADVMIPLLQKMHMAGVVHRDVKPSNCIRMGTTSANKDFLMVDFGLSKSIVVPSDSAYADPKHKWTNDLWNKPPQFSNQNKQQKKVLQGHLRKERPTAEFRGTSMYASLRVHQSKDYSRRDDMWSLLYVFCDLVSGGLPWMSHAATRDREACRKLKELIHGEVAGDDAEEKKGSEENGNRNNIKPTKQIDQIEQMLMGDEHHVTKYNREVAVKKGVEKLPSVSPPLALSHDVKKVQLLRDAFQHVAQLSFADEPDYKWIQKCLHGFLEQEDRQETNATTATTNSNKAVDVKDRKVERIDWECDPDRKSSAATATAKRKMDDRIAPTWDLDDYTDPLDINILYEAEVEAKTQAPIGEPIKKKLKLDELDIARLPLLLQFRIAQMEYNTKYASKVEPHLGLRDWLNCVYLLTHEEWDTAKNERGNHRYQNDGYRQDVLLRVMEKCVEGAKAFDNFRHCSCLKEKVLSKDDHNVKKNGEEVIASKNPMWKLRRISTSLVGENITFATVSIAVFALAQEIRKERNKKSSPPPALSFGSGIGGDQNL